MPDQDDTVMVPEPDDRPDVGLLGEGLLRVAPFLQGFHMETKIIVLVRNDDAACVTSGGYEDSDDVTRDMVQYIKQMFEENGLGAVFLMPKPPEENVN